MKKKCSLEDRTITVPGDLMQFAIDRCSSMIHVNPYKNINRILAEAYLLACNDMTQIRKEGLI